MRILSKFLSVTVALLFSTYLTGQDCPDFISGIEDYVEFLNEANRRSNAYLVDLVNMKDSLKNPDPKEYKNERMILEESIQNSLIVSLLTTDMIAFINLSGYIQCIDKNQLKGEAFELIRVDVIENYTKRIDVMIKAATQNSLLTNSRSILTILDQFKKDLRALREKLIEIQKDLLTGSEQLNNQKDE